MWALLAACAPSSTPPPPPAPPPPTRAERADAAVARAVDAILGSPLAAERLDPLMALAAIDRARPDPSRAAGIEALRIVVDTGGDPRRRWWDPSARWPDAAPHAWTPEPGRRVTPNFALVEALYCPSPALRPETVRWVCDTLRDDGGRLSGHAAWILDLGVDQGCVARADTCLDALREELTAAALRSSPGGDTDARDVFAEQILFATLAGAPAEALAPAVDALLAAQGDDGGFGAPGDRSFAALHATAASAWALAEWRAAGGD